MFDLLLSGPYVPFTVALALLFGLLALEVLLSLLGGSLLGLDADADLDVDLDVDMDVDFDVDVDLDLDAPDLDADFELETGANDGLASAGPAAWLGMGRMPTLIWLAALLLGFGLSGVVLQSLAASVWAPLPAMVASVPAATAGIWFARTFGAVFARVLPKTETTAMSARHLGRRIGVVTQGTARRGAPSEVKVTDRHGNIHYLRAEPLKDDVEIPRGTRVLVLRHQADTGYRLVPLGADE